MFQEIKIMGYVGQDPTIRYTRTGAKVANLSVAVNKKSIYHVNSRREGQTAWFSVEAWGELADEIQALCKARLLAKGSQVMVIGELLFDPETGGPRIYLRRNGKPGATFVLRSHQIVAIDGEDISERDWPEQPEVPGEMGKKEESAQVVATDNSVEFGENDIPF